MPNKELILGSGITWDALQVYGGGVIVRILRNRLARETGTIVLLVGSPGTGKSFSALWLASQIDPSFNVSRVVFDVKSYLDILASGTVAGQAVLLDEAGVTAPARKWQSPTNIALALTVESVRHRGLLTLVTVPDAAMVDNTVRKLAYMVINCRRIDRKAEQVIARPYLVRPNFITGIIYMKNPVTLLGNKQEPVKWRLVRFPRPAIALETAYLSKRAEIMDALYRQLSESLSDAPPGGIEAPTYWQCLSCGHRWKSRVATPSICVKCRKPKIEPVKRSID